MAENEDGLLFAGLKVLDVGTWIAGPVSATILADFGADVIKVEIPGAGDPYRALPSGPLSPKSHLNYTWLMDARNKRSIALNLKSEEGMAILLSLVRDCDVYVTNQVLPLRRQLRLTYEDLAPHNPKMIYASLTPYGESGPDSGREAFDGVAWWARSGLMDLVRAEDAPHGMSVPGMGDHPTAVSLYAAIVTALLRRERTGKGGMVHTSLLANGLWANACLGQAAVVHADFSPRTATRLPSPNRILFETSDARRIQLYMVRTEDELVRLLLVLGLEEILAEERFATHAARIENAEALIPLLQAAFLRRTAREWLAACHAESVPISLVAVLEDLPDDEQMIAAGALVPPADPAVGCDLVINHPVNIEGLVRRGPLPAPTVGQHTDEVLASLGYSPGQVATLRSSGAIG